MKYKVGDKVKIKSLDWYNENNKEHGFEIDGVLFDPDMSVFCGNVANVERVSSNFYKLDIDGGSWCWYDWMFEYGPTISDQLKEKRFHAACSAMNGILSTEYSKPISNDKIVQMSYMLADELLKQGGFTE